MIIFIFANLFSGGLRRLLQFVESGMLNPTRFQDIIARHDLTAAWRKFEKQFLDDEP